MLIYDKFTKQVIKGPIFKTHELLYITQIKAIIIIILKDNIFLQKGIVIFIQNLKLIKSDYKISAWMLQNSNNNNLELDMINQRWKPYLFKLVNECLFSPYVVFLVYFGGRKNK